MCEVLVSKTLLFKKTLFSQKKPIVFPKNPLFSNMCTFLSHCFETKNYHWSYITIKNTNIVQHKPIQYNTQQCNIMQENNNNGIQNQTEIMSYIKQFCFGINVFDSHQYRCSLLIYLKLLLVFAQYGYNVVSIDQCTLYLP